MNRLIRVVCAASVACVMTWLSPQVVAQTDVLGILDSLDVSQHDDSADLKINFSVPVHYVRHFPVSEGDVVQITVNTVSVGSLGVDARQRHESLTWTPSREVPLYDVTYEGSSTKGPNLIVRFRHPVKFKVDESGDSRSIIVTVISPPKPPEAPAVPQPLPQAPPAAPPTPSMPMLAPVPESKVAEWMAQGRQAMTASDYPQAIRIFTKVLQHPGHKYLPEAKELLGLARERNKQFAHARAEYEEYLRLYPQGEGAQRVRQRLDALLTASEPGKEKLRGITGGGRAAAGGMTVNGNISQYYQRTMNKTDQTGTVTTQSSLINYLDVGSRSRGDRYDVRSQFTGNYIYDFLPDITGTGTASGVSVSSLYVDASDRQHQLSTRIGRQTRSNGGVLGRFDGGLFTVGVVPNWKLNAVAGSPVDLSANNTIQTNHTLYGMSLDGSGLAKHWDTSAFAIHQVVYGITDRTAVGTELRYFTPMSSVFTLVDYDVSYSELNIVLTQANWQLESGAGVNLALDYRLSPTLTTSNALQGQTVTTVKDLLAALGGDESQLRQLALDRTARSKMATLGGNVPLNQQLQVTGDFTLSNLGGLPASTSPVPIDAVEGTGNEYIYSVQMIGSSLIKEGDVSIIGVSYYDAKDSNTSSLTLNTRYPVTNNWRVNPRLRIDYKTSTTGGNTVSYKPQLRTDYRLRKELTFEMEGGVEWDNQISLATAQNPGAATLQNTEIYYLSIGYRWNF
jgi:hypothetical protein